MKKTLNITVLLLALTIGAANVSASRPLPPVTPVDSTTVVAGGDSVLTNDSLPPDEVEAFSDTTATDTAAVGFDPWDTVEDEWSSTSGYSFFEDVDIDTDSLMGMLFVISILLVIFVLAPVALIGLILYFVYKNRKQRLRLAEMAMSKGRTIPFDALGGVVRSYDALMNKGIKQVFLGLGLSILLWIPLGKLGLAIGALILLIGCGNLVIAYKERSKQQQQQMYDRIFNGRNHSADHAAKSDAPNDVEIVGEPEN